MDGNKHPVSKKKKEARAKEIRTAILEAITSAPDDLKTGDLQRMVVSNTGNVILIRKIMDQMKLDDELVSERIEGHSGILWRLPGTPPPNPKPKDPTTPPGHAICNACGGIRPSFGKKINPMLLKYAQWDIEDNGSFLELNGALYTKPIETRVKLTGTSLGFTFPRALMRYLDLEHGDAVQLIIIPDPERDKRRK